MSRIGSAVALAGVALSFIAAPAGAQAIGSGYYYGSCRYVGARLSCPGASRAYQRWDNGAVTGGFGSGGDASHHYYPHNWGGYSTFYGYGH